MQIGWGEGLDEAARYLNTKTTAADLHVISWYSPGSFSYFFKGDSRYLGFEKKPDILSGKLFFLRLRCNLHPSMAAPDDSRLDARISVQPNSRTHSMDQRDRVCAHLQNPLKWLGATGFSW